MPAVLFECFFMDNKKECKEILLTEGGRDLCAEWIYKTILNNVREGIILPENMEVLKQRLHVKYNKEENNGVLPTKLYAIKKKVDKINEMEFQKL